MNARMFQSFVKTAMELQADQDTPGDYVATLAAIEAKFGKIASRADRFLDRAERFTPALSGFGMGVATASMAQHHSDKHKEKSERRDHGGGKQLKGIAERSVAGVAGAAAAHHGMKHLKARFNKLAAGVLHGATRGYANHLELAGLGTLAAPAVAGLSGHHMKDKHKDVAEVAGLGILAAPYAHNLAKDRSARYAGTRVAKKLTDVFAH